MKGVTSKMCAIVAMIISLISFTLLIISLILSYTTTPPEAGVSRPFAFWIYSYIVALFSLIFYVFDAIVSIVEAFLKQHIGYNIFLSAVTIGSVPMAILLGSSPGYGTIIWNLYYLVLFVLEVISIVHCIKHEEIQ